MVVGGSGNTYDRKSIEKHFQHCHRDPLNNMDARLLFMAVHSISSPKSVDSNCGNHSFCMRSPLNLEELRRPADRKLIPNNQLRSQIRNWT